MERGKGEFKSDFLNSASRKAARAWGALRRGPKCIEQKFRGNWSSGLKGERHTIQCFYHGDFNIKKTEMVTALNGRQYRAREAEKLLQSGKGRNGRGPGGVGISTISMPRRNLSPGK